MNMARIEDIERRLLNWARWRALMQDGGGNYARASLEERVDGQGYDAPTVIGTSDAEAEVTDHAVMALESHLRAAVEAHYLGNGTAERKARRLFVSLATLKLRIEAAHRAISSWLSDRARTQREQRLRVEMLNNRSRP